MAIHTADALVLRQYPYRETSVIVTCLTDRFGKITGLVKGLRDGRMRHRSAMEPLSVNRIVFYDVRSGSMHLISQCDLVESFHGLTRDLELMRVAAACAELADAILQPGEPHPDVFGFMQTTLARLVEGHLDPPSMRIHAVLRLLRLAGFHPQLDECVACSQPASTMSAYWSARQGGLLCERCLHEDPGAEHVTGAWLSLLHACAEAPQPLALEPAHAGWVQHRLDEFLRWHVDRPLKAHRAPSASGQG